MKRLRGRLGWVGIGLAAAAVALLPFTGINAYAMTFLFVVMFNAALAVGWNILGGYAGYASFGHVAFVGVGGYATALPLSLLGWSPLFTAPLGGAAAVILAVLVGYPCLRLRGPYFALVTLIVSLAVAVVVLNLPGVDAAAGIFLPPPSDSRVISRFVLYEAIASILLVTIVVARLVERSRLGVGLVAIREDEEVAATQGIPTTRLKLTGFALSAGLAGLAGGVFSWHLGFLEPGSMFDINLSILVVLFALLGGTRSWPGPLVGAVLVTFLQEFLSLWAGASAAQIAFGVLLIFVILFLPDGLLGSERFDARIAKQAPPKETAG